MSDDNAKAEANPYHAERFSPHVGTDFTVRLETGASLDVELKEVTENAAVPGQYSLIFHDPQATVEAHLPQAVYSFAHDQLGEIDIFIVPVGPDTSGTGILYEAVFS